MEATRQSTALVSSGQPVLGRVPASRGWRSGHVLTARSAPLGAQSQQAASRVIAQAVPPSRGAPVRATIGAEAPVATSASVASGAPRCDAFQSAKSLFEALNRRDVSAVLTLMAEDVVYDNLSTSSSLRGRAAVGRFYLEALAAIPENAVFVLEHEEQELAAAAGRWGGSSNVTGAAPVLQAGLAWHMELNGVPVPLSRGMGVYWADPRTGLLTRVWENPEPAFKAALPLLTSAAWASASPLLGGLTRGVSSLLSTLGSSSSSSTNGSPISSSDSTSSSSNGGAFGAASTTPGVPSLPNMASVLGGILPFGGPAPASASTSAPPASSQAASGPQAAAAGKATQQPAGRSTFSDHTGRVTTTPLVAAPQGARPAGGGVSNGAWAAAAAAAAAKQVAAPGTAPPSAPVPAAVGPAAAPSAAPAAPPPPAAAAAPSAAAEALSSKGEPIRMRPLSEPQPQPEPDSGSTSSSGEESSTPAPASPSSSVVEPTSKASTATAVAGSAAATAASAAPAVGARASPILLPAAGSAAAAASSSQSAPSPFLTGGGGSFASVDDGGDAPAGSSVDSGAAAGTVASASGGGGGGGSSGGGWKLPFERSYGMNVDLTSLWEKDVAASQVEEYEAMLDVLELGGLQKVTARLIDGLDLKQAEDKFEVSFVTIVPFFRVTEKSRFTAATSMMRRDLRGGRQSSIASRVPGGVEVRMTWDNPLAGSLTEEYLVSEDGSALAVTSDMRIGQRQAKATQIYRRSSRNRNEFLNSQRAAAGSMEDVLRKQEQKFGKIKY